MLAEHLKREVKNGDYVSVEEFKEIEKNFIGKVEYVDGRIYMFAGSLWHHNSIRKILEKKLDSSLKNGCESRSEEPWYYSDENDKLYLIPDLMVVCDAKTNVIDGKYKGKPKFIIEILSDSTSKYDSNEKKQKYKELGVEEYILVDYEIKKIELFELQNSNTGITYYYATNKEFEFISKINQDIKFKLSDIFFD